MTWWKLAPLRVRIAVCLLSVVLLVLLSVLPPIGKLALGVLLAMITLIWCIGTIVQYVMDYDFIKRKHERDSEKFQYK